jgi:two-component system invasion response regulator UvrY
MVDVINYQGRPMRRVLIVDDHEVVRVGVKKMLEEQTGATAFGEASTGPEALKLACEQHWDVAVLELSIGGRNGLEVLKELRQVRPHLPVLILSGRSEEQYARRAFKAGAAGYVTKDSPGAELIKAISKVVGGGRYVSSALAEKLVVDLEKGADGLPHELLSDREFEVMSLIASGKTISQIAGQLCLSGKTISTYRTRILDKMEMKTSAELTHYALRHNLVD